MGKGRKHSATPSSSAGDGMGTSIPASPLLRVLLSTMQGAPPHERRSTPAKPRGTKGTRCIHVGIYVVLMLYAYWYLYTFYYSCWYLCCTKGTRGCGRGRAVAATPSEVEATQSPPPLQADSPEHMTSRVDSSEVEATRSPVHEPRVDEPQVDEPLTHETRVPEASFHTTAEHSRDEGTSQETQWDPWQSQLAMLVATRSWVRGIPSTSVVVRGSRSCRRPPSRGGRLCQMGTSKLIYSYLTFYLHVF